MKKQALLATVSLALVALASCGGSESVSEEPAGEPTLQEQWAAIENWQGGVSAIDFFTKTATLTSESYKATSREVVSEDLSGEVGVMFGMESDWGYINQTYTQSCKIYNNNRRVCGIEEKTDYTDPTSKQVVTDVVKQTAVAYFETVEETTSYYNVVDDNDSDTYEIQNNYYTTSAVQSGTTFKDYAGFALSTTSGIGQRLTFAYYASTTHDDPEVKYYTNPTDDGVEYIYWAYMDFTADGFAGHTMSIKIAATFNGDTLVGVDLEQGYYYSGSSVYLSNQYLEYGYADNGDYNEAVPDHSLYKLFGTIEFSAMKDSTEGADFDTYWDKLLYTAAGYTAATGLTWGLPTSSTVQNYVFNDISYSRTYEMVEDITTNVYSNGYVVRDYAKQEINVEKGGVDKASASVQLSYDTTNIYRVVHNYDNTSYKITTAITDKITWAAVSDISEWDAISWMMELQDIEGEEATSPAEEIETRVYVDEAKDTFELLVQGIKQQKGNVIGYRYYADVVVEFVRDADTEEIVGIRVLESLILIDGYYNWEEAYAEQVKAKYGYAEAKTTTAANYTPYNPNDFTEYVKPSARVA